MSQTLSCPVPDNIDPLSPNGFQLTIAKLPTVSFFCQEADIPGLTMTPLGVKTPLVKMNFATNQIEYSAFNVSFMIDSKMDNYMSILGWMEGLGFPETYQQYTDFQEAQRDKGLSATHGNYDFSAGTLIILGSNNQAIRSIEFIDMIPVSISSVVFATTNTDVKYLIGKATFAYDYFKMK